MNIEINAFEEHLKNMLINEVKQHLHTIIDKEIENIAKDTVVKFIEVSIDSQMNPMSIKNEYLFKFVQNCTETIIERKIVKEI